MTDEMVYVEPTVGPPSRPRMASKYKQKWLTHYEEQGIEIRSTFRGFEVKIGDEWEFVHVQEIGAFSRGFNTALERVAQMIQDGGVNATK